MYRMRIVRKYTLYMISVKNCLSEQSLHCVRSKSIVREKLFSFKFTQEKIYDNKFCNTIFKCFSYFYCPECFTYTILICFRASFSCMKAARHLNELYVRSAYIVWSYLFFNTKHMRCLWVVYTSFYSNHLQLRIICNSPLLRTQALV